MSYQDEQAKTRKLLKAWKLIKGYEFNMDSNRAARRTRVNKWERKLTGMNAQTLIKPKKAKA